MGFDTFSLAFLHFFSPILFLLGWYTSFREGRIIYFAFYDVCKNQEAGAIMSFHFFTFVFVRRNKGIAEGGKERLTLLLSYRKTKQASALLYSTRYSTLAVSLLDYERDNSFGGKMKYFGITLQSSMNEKKTINTRNSRSRTGVSKYNNTPRNVFCQKYNSSQFE